MKDTSGSAFPWKVMVTNGSTDPFTGSKAIGDQVYAQGGISIRDYFAAKAIPEAVIWENACPTKTETSQGIPQMSGIAEKAYQLADAMLAERSKP